MYDLNNNNDNYVVILYVVFLCNEVSSCEMVNFCFGFGYYCICICHAILFVVVSCVGCVSVAHLSLPIEQ